jgi:hypothetical protein
VRDVTNHQEATVVAQAQIIAYVEAMRRAAEGADAEQEQWERLRRRLAPRPQSRPHRVADVCREYEEETGVCLGCD